MSGAGRPGRVLRTTTSQGTGFGIRYPESGELGLPQHQMSVWIKDTNTFYFYVRVRGTNGGDYSIRYQPTGGSPYAYKEYAITPVGTQYRDGTWHELSRDLDADLRAVFGVGVEYVKWFSIRGNYDLDDLTLLGEGEEVKYYFFNGRRIAMRKDGVVQYLLGDHLGSTSLVLDSTGNKVAESRHREASRSAAEWAIPTAWSVGATARYQRTTNSQVNVTRPALDFTIWGRVFMTARWPAG